MMRGKATARVTVVVGFLILAALSVDCKTDMEGVPVKIIPVDSMSRIFPDQVPEQVGELAPLHVARGEACSFQYALVSDADTVATVRTSPVAHENGFFFPGTREIYHLQTVHVEGNNAERYGSPDQHPGFFVRHAPFDVAEILVKTDRIALKKGRTEAILLDVKVDRKAVPGIYQGVLTVETESGIVQAPFVFEVHKAALPETPKLDAIHWLSLNPRDLTNKNIPEKWYTKRHWDLIEQAGRVLYEYGDRRMNSPILYDTEGEGRHCLIQTIVNPDGSLEFDYTRFDRWCNIFLGIGYEKIVGFALGANFPLPTCGSIVATEKATGKETILFTMGKGYEEIEAFEKGEHINDATLLEMDKEDSDTFIPAMWDEFSKSERYVEVRDRWLAFLETLLTDLREHLLEKGWYDNYEQQVIDEPRTTKEYVRIVQLFRKCMPGVPVADAIHAYLVPDPENFSPYVDNWQTPLYFISTHQDIVKDRRAKGLKTGVYNLVTGPPSPNLHIDEHLTHTRLFPWLIYRYGGQSSLNWACNRYRGVDPYAQSRGAGGHPPGHTWQFYPGPDGLLSSLRMIAWRDGMADFDLLTMLQEKDPQLAGTILKRMVRSPFDYEREASAYHQARIELLQALDGHMDEYYKTYTVRRAKNEVPLDGNWDGGPWNNVEPLLIANYMGEKPNHIPKTEAKLLYDKKYIHVMFRVEDQYVRAIAENSWDYYICQDSCVEFFFTPQQTFTGNYFKVEINCGGTVFSMFSNKLLSREDLAQIETWHSEPKIVFPEKTEPTTWILQYRIPYEVLEKYTSVAHPGPGVKWQADFYKCADLSSHPHWLTWTKADWPEPNFGLAQYFGTLEFE